MESVCPFPQILKVHTKDVAPSRMDACCGIECIANTEPLFWTACKSFRGVLSLDIGKVLMAETLIFHFVLWLIAPVLDASLIVIRRPTFQLLDELFIEISLSHIGMNRKIKLFQFYRSSSAIL